MDGERPGVMIPPFCQVGLKRMEKGDFDWMALIANRSGFKTNIPYEEFVQMRMWFLQARCIYIRLKMLPLKEGRQTPIPKPFSSKS